MQGAELMARMTKHSRKKTSSPTLSNTGFIGATFTDLDDLTKYEYYFSRKKLQITHHVLDGLLQGSSILFSQHGIPAHISCIYLPKQKKIGLVLSKKPFRRKEGKSYFINYLREVGHLNEDEKIKEHEIFNTGFIGVIFADLSKVERFTFQFELELLSQFLKGLIIPAKELFLRHNIQAYISSVELTNEGKIGFVLSKKPYDERKEADLYFIEYLKERGLYEEEEEFIPIHSEKTLF